MPLNEQQAFQMMQIAPQLEGAERAKARELMAEYKATREAAGSSLFPEMDRRNLEKKRKVRSMFQDRETHGFDESTLTEMHETFRDHLEEKTRFFNIQFLADQLQLSTDEISADYETARDVYASKRFGMETADDESFYSRVGESFDLEDDALEKAQFSGMVGLSGIEGFAMWRANREGNISKAQEEALSESYQKIADATASRLSPYRSTITGVIDALREKTGVTDFDSENQSWSELTKQISEVPESDRGLVIAAIIANGSGEDDEKAFAKKLGENFARGARDLGIGVLSSAERKDLQVARGRIASGLIPATSFGAPEDIVEFSVRNRLSAVDAFTAETEFQKVDASDPESGIPQALALIDSQLNANELHSQLRQIADGEIDPAKSEGLVTQGLLDASRSLPYMLASLVPGGFVATSEALTDDSYHALRRSGVSREEANVISTVAGPIQGALERVSGKILTGKLPALDRFMKQSVVSKGGVAIRFGSRLAGATGLELLQENAQDLTPFVLQEITSALSEDVPSVNWGEVIGTGEDQLKLLFATLPLSLIGSGVGTYRDFKGSEQLFTDSEMLQTEGITADQANEIVSMFNSGDKNGAQAKYREAWKGRNTEQAEAKKVEVAETLEREGVLRSEVIQELEAAGRIPALSRNADGWTVRFNDETTASFETHEEADLARWQVVAETALEVSAVTRAAIQQVERDLEAGREITYEFSPEVMTGQRAVDEGLATEEQVLNRAEIAETVGSEYRTAIAESNVSTRSDADRLASLQILGSNQSEFAEGIQKTTIRLFQGATPLTVIEEKLESDASRLLSQEGGREWLQEALTIYQERTGDTILTGNSDADLREAYSHLGQSYFVGKSNKQRDDIVSGWKKKGFRKWTAEVLRSPLGSAYQAYTNFFRSVWRRAAKLDKLQREGGLDSDLEQELARSVGLSESFVENQRTIETAQSIRDELAGALAVDESAPFSILPRSVQSVASGAFAIVPSEVTFSNARPIDNDTFSAPEALAGETLSEVDPENDAWATELETETGISLRFFRQESGERIDGLLDTETGEFWLNAASDVPVGATIIHEQVHRLTENDPEGMAKLFASIIDQLSLDELNIFTTPIAEAYPDTFKDEILPHLAELAYTGHNETGVEIANLSAIKELFDGYSAPENNQSFSAIDNPEGTIAALFDPFQRSPELRQRLGLEMKKRGGVVAQKLTPILAANRSAKSIDEERKATQEKLFSEKLEQLSDTDRAALESDSAVTDARQNPVVELLTRQTRDKNGRLVTRGRLESKSAFEKRTSKKAPGEYDGASELKLPSYMYGGRLAPDQAAQELFEEGLIASPDVDLMWSTLNQAFENAAARTAEQNAAQSEIDRLTSEARSEAQAIADEQLNAKEVIGTDRETLRAFMRTLNAIVSALPPEVRGRIGGFVQLAELVTPRAMLNEIEKRIGMIDRHLEIYLKKEADVELKKLWKRTKPTKGKAGEKPKGKAGADIHDLFDKLKEVTGLDAEKVESQALALDSEIAKGEMSPEQEAHATLEANLIRLFGDWRHADSARRWSALENGRDVWTTGYNEFQTKLAKEREKRAENRAALIKASGNAGTSAERKKRLLADNGLVGKTKEVILAFLSFEQATAFVFGRDSETALMITDMERRAAAQKTEGDQAAQNGIRDLFTELAGGHYKGTVLQHEMSRPSIDTKAGKLSELEALSAIMMWRQEDGRRHMEGRADENGDFEWQYDQEFVDNITASVTPKGWAVLDYLTEQYANEYESINTVYRDLYGINLPSHGFYSPLTVKPLNENAPDIDPVSGMANGGGIDAALKTRSVSAVAEPDFRDVLNTFVGHTKQMEHFKAYAPFVREAGSLLNNRKVGNSIQGAAGKEAAQVLRKWVQHFREGGNRDAGEFLAANQMFRRIMNRFTSMAIVGRIGTVAIQFTQAGAAMVEMPMVSYTKRMGMLLSGNLGWKAAFDSPYIQRRLTEMPPVVRQAMQGLKSEKPNEVKHAMQRVGQFISGSDALFTAGTYAIIYDYQLAEAKSLGLSGAEAEAFAQNAAERSTDRVAQPTRAGARSLYENVSTNAIMKMLWNFASEPRKNMGLMAFYLAKGTPQEKARVFTYVFIFNAMFGQIFRAAWRDARDDEDDDLFDEKHWDMKRLALATFTDPLSGFPILGDALKSTIYDASGEFNFSNDPLKKGVRLPGDLIDIASEVMEGDYDTENTLRDMERALEGYGLFNPTASALASAFHLIRDVEGLVKNISE